MSSRVARLVESYQSFIDLPWEKAWPGCKK